MRARGVVAIRRDRLWRRVRDGSATKPKRLIMPKSILAVICAVSLSSCSISRSSPGVVLVGAFSSIVGGSGG
jgi:hypothetical protein